MGSRSWGCDGGRIDESERLRLLVECRVGVGGRRLRHAEMGAFGRPDKRYASASGGVVVPLAKKGFLLYIYLPIYIYLSLSIGSYSIIIYANR